MAITIGMGKKKSAKGMTYADAGVNFKTHEKLVGEIFKRVRSTYGSRVQEVENGFGGLFSMETKYGPTPKNPMLVACTDGVGTKLKLAFQMGKHDTVGIDCVAMSVNDMLCMGAQPLFFLDYIATGKKDLDVLLPLVSGVVEGCKLSGCSLLGGETAEMPGFYPKGEYDIAGFAVGVVDAKKIIKGDDIREGDIVVGIESSGIHSNGYSLVRRIVTKKRWELGQTFNDLGCTLGEELLRPTRIYAKAIGELLETFKRKKAVTGIANITGGGFFENIPRILPKGLKAAINPSAWNPAPVFDLLAHGGNVDPHEMFNVFNMGIGMTLIVRPKHVDDVRKQIHSTRERGQKRLKTHVIGEIRKGKKSVELVG